MGTPFTKIYNTSIYITAYQDFIATYNTVMTFSNGLVYLPISASVYEILRLPCEAQIIPATSMNGLPFDISEA